MIRNSNKSPQSSNNFNYKYESKHIQILPFKIPAEYFFVDTPDPCLLHLPILCVSVNTHCDHFSQTGKALLL